MSEEQRKYWAVVPAAGTGSRMGGALPKQYTSLSGKTLLELSLRALLDCADIEVVVVALRCDDSRAAGLDILTQPRIHCVEGGAERGDSVLAGLDALAGLADAHDWVLVHDAARPCLAQVDLARLIGRVSEAGIGGILAEPIVDTVKLADDDGRVVRTLDRNSLWRAQTPQMFRLGELRRAMRSAVQQGQPVTDEASAMELAGYPVQLVPGSRRNLKVTLPDDLELAGWYLNAATEGRAK